MAAYAWPALVHILLLFVIFMAFYQYIHTCYSNEEEHKLLLGMNNV